MERLFWTTALPTVRLWGPTRGQAADCITCEAFMLGDHVVTQEASAYSNTCGLPLVLWKGKGKRRKPEERAKANLAKVNAG